MSTMITKIKINRIIVLQAVITIIKREEYISMI